jgi:hypothetical protein
MAEVTPERVTLTDPLANATTQQLEGKTLDGADKDPDWVPGIDTPGRRKARTSHSGGTASESRASRFYGVSWHKPSCRWWVQLLHDGQKHYLGYFAEDKEEDAARAYDTAARRLRGVWAHGGRSGANRWLLNVPTEAEVAGADEAASASTW